MLERLQKVMAQAGVASRRKCEEMIAAGQVQVNDRPVTELGAKVDPAADIIKVNGRILHSEQHVYLMFNKPKGVITAMSDPKGRKAVADFLSRVKERVFPVGRLDYDSEGLILLTNDGELANRMLHPRHHVPKTYLATVKGVPHGNALDRLKAGIKLEDGVTQPAEVEYHDVDPERGRSVISITIYEGKNRQVRRMFEAIGYPVQRLKRIQFGPLFLQSMQRGKYRYLTPEEVEELKDFLDADNADNS